MRTWPAAFRRGSSFRVDGIRADERGATLVDFALAAPILVGLLLGIAELGMVMFTTSLMEGALRDASRYGVTGRTADGVDRLTRIRQLIAERTLNLVDMSQAQIDVLTYPSFSRIGTGEAYIDGNGNGAYDPGETFTDENGNGAWDSDVGQAGPGDAGDVVLYRIRYDWPLMTPYLGLFMGHDGVLPLTASLAVRNEPWVTSGG